MVPEMRLIGISSSIQLCAHITVLLKGTGNSIPVSQDMESSPCLL